MKFLKVAGFIVCTIVSLFILFLAINPVDGIQPLSATIAFLGIRIIYLIGFFVFKK